MGMGDFVGYCVACGCHIEEEHDEGAGYVNVIEERYQVLGRFANLYELLKSDGGTLPDEYSDLKPETPYFYTLRAFALGGRHNVDLYELNIPYELRHKTIYERDRAGFWAFPLHECCLEILDQAIMWSQKPRSGISYLPSRARFYDAVCQQEAAHERNRDAKPEHQKAKRLGVSWDHGYYGVQHRWAKEYSLLGLGQGMPYPGSVDIGADPLKIRHLTSFLRLHLGLVEHGPLPNPFNGPPPPPPPFQPVPVWCNHHFRIRTPQPSRSSTPGHARSTNAMNTTTELHCEVRVQRMTVFAPQESMPDVQDSSVSTQIDQELEWSSGTPSVSTNSYLGPLALKNSRAASTTQAAPLATVPTELLTLITQHLPLRSIISLHCTCKTVASRLPLTLEFWRSALLSNALLGFTWDLDSSMSQDGLLRERWSDEALGWDWRELGRALARNGLFGEDEDTVVGTPEGLKARRRIWKCIMVIGKSMAEIPP